MARCRHGPRPPCSTAHHCGGVESRLPGYDRAMRPSSGLPPNSYRVALDHPATAALLRRYRWQSWAFLLMGGVPLLLTSPLEVPFFVLAVATLLGVIPGLAGILRAARRGQVLRRQPW